ncbi:MAG: DNA polymerase III subunit alpha [Phycisphaerae bacterium]
MDGFAHLHVHSHYSLLDGMGRIDELVKEAHAHGMTALALTDHGNLFGAAEFYHEATRVGVKPILGLEAYISPTTRGDRSMGNIEEAAYHLLLLAMNDEGWHNLMRLSSRSFLEGFYYRPRIDRELLAQFNAGLICCTACLGGEIPTALLTNQPQKARRIAGEYKDIFGPERLFVEIMNQGIPDQDRANPLLVELAGEMGLQLVGTNDVHFLRRADKPAHEVLTAISTGKTLAEGGALSYPPEIYLKTPAEMRQALAAWPTAADNTLKIAEMCNAKIHSRKHLPPFKTPDGQTAEQYMTALAWEGLARRFKGEIPDEYRKRLEWELKVIVDKGYSSYFLIVNDFVQYARRNNIPAAPRGSGVATLLGYALGIADVDPLKYGLLFERFTDPQRKEDPDIDIDMCQEGRAKVIQYVREKYGHVAQIITYGTLGAKAVVRDVGRAMGVSLAEVDAIAKKIPGALNTTLESALEGEPELRRMYDSDARIKQLIDYGLRLEGLARHAGVHAAGVVICDVPLEDLLPLYKQADSDDVITQWDGPTCEKAGLMKMDFLGLRTLTILQRAADLVNAKRGTGILPVSSAERGTGILPVSSTGVSPVEAKQGTKAEEETIQGQDAPATHGQDARATAREKIDPEALPLDDPKVFDLFRRGCTDGVFQFESDGMKGVLMQMGPTRIEDLIAANAMYRPGPMELISTYCARKAGREEVPSLHPLVDGLLAETYGIMVYQEQVMQVLNRLGKLPLNRALTLIKAISKKKAKTIEEEKPNFMAGAKDNGIGDDEAERLFELILKFAGYGFNKAHSTRYAILAYQTAWFKVYHPREFLAATLTFESGDTDKVVKYMTEAGRMGVKVAPPDINACDRDFTVDGQRVRFGLAAVKGVGDKAVQAIIDARKTAGRFKDLFHFCRNVDLRAVNRATIEALIKCGAFDSLGASRAAMAAALDHAIELGQAALADRRSGQMNLLEALGGGPGAEEPAARFPNVEPWSEAQLLQAEKEALGFYVSSHPLVRFGRELESLSQPEGMALARLEQAAEGARVLVGCMIAQVRPTVTKTGKSAGKRMAMLTLEDLTGKADAVVFSDAFERIGGLLAPEAMVFISGSVDRRRERPSIIVDEVFPIDKAVEQITGTILLRLPGSQLTTQNSQLDGFLKRLHDVLVRFRGNCPVIIEMRPAGRPDVKAFIRPDKTWHVQPSRRLVDELVGLLGEENLVLRPKAMETPRRSGYGRGNGTYYSNKPAPARQGTLINGQASPAVTRFN